LARKINPILDHHKFLHASEPRADVPATSQAHHSTNFSFQYRKIEKSHSRTSQRFDDGGHLRQCATELEISQKQKLDFGSGQLAAMVGDSWLSPGWPLTFSEPEIAAGSRI